MILQIQIQPNAKENKIINFENNILKLKIKAPAIENKANIELIKYLSEIYNIPKQLISIKKGLTSKNKLIEINEITSNRS